MRAGLMYADGWIFSGSFAGTAVSGPALLNSAHG